MKFSIKNFFSKCDQIRTDLVTFTEEILNGKLHFFCNERRYIHLSFIPLVPISVINFISCNSIAIFVYFLYIYLLAQYGIRKPWYFPFTRSFWTGGDNRKIGISAIGNNENRYSNLTSDSNVSI